MADYLKDSPGLSAMPNEHERHQSVASKQSRLSTDTSFQSIHGSLGASEVRRPSSATSYSAHGIGNAKQPTISPAGASSSGTNINGGGATVKAPDRDAIPINHQDESGSGIYPPLGQQGIAEEDQITAVQTEPAASIKRTLSNKVPTERIPSPVSVGQIHPGMEIFNSDTGRRPTGPGMISKSPLNSPPLAASPRIHEPRLNINFHPTHSFLITKIGTPGLSQTVDGGTPKHVLRNRGWEIRDVSSSIRRSSDPTTNVQRAGTGGIGGKHTAAEVALEQVVDGIFNSWGARIDAGSQSSWRRSFDSSALSPTPSTSSFFSHLRSQIPPHTPISTPNSPRLVVVSDRGKTVPSGPPLSPPDPTYVSIKHNPTSSKSTFYSIETSPITQSPYPQELKDRHKEDRYPSETDRTPIAQWKVPYSVQSPSKITLLTNDTHHHQSQKGHHRNKSHIHKSSKVELWTSDSNIRTQFFEMDRSTYYWEFKTRPKLRVPVSNSKGSETSSLAPSVAPSFIGYSGTQSPRIPYPSSPISPMHFNSVPSTPTNHILYPFGDPSNLLKPESKTVKFRSEMLLLVKEIDGFKYIVGEYYFLKSIKSTTVSTVPTSPTSHRHRLRRFVSSSSANPGTPTSTYEPNVNHPPPTPSTVASSIYKEKESVRYSNIGKHQAGILLLDSRVVNKVIAINSLLIALKRERQRKVVTLGMSNKGVNRRRGWGYGISLSPVDLGYDGEEMASEDEGDDDDVGAHDDHAWGHPHHHPHSPIIVAGHPKSPAMRPQNYNEEGDVLGNDIERAHDGEAGDGKVEEEDDVDNIETYSLREDDWEWQDQEGWVRKGPDRKGSERIGGRGGVG